jgi:hypothetical protein
VPPIELPLTEAANPTCFATELFLPPIWLAASSSAAFASFLRYSSNSKAYWISVFY